MAVKAKKYSQQGERLKAFIYSKWETVDQCAEELELSADSIRNNYLSGKSLLGAELLMKFVYQGLDAKYYLTGYGLPPNPSEAQIEEHIAGLETKLAFWKDYKATLMAARRELEKKRSEQYYEDARKERKRYTDDNSQ